MFRLPISGPDAEEQIVAVPDPLVETVLLVAYDEKMIADCSCRAFAIAADDRKKRVSTTDKVFKAAYAVLKHRSWSIEAGKTVHR